MFQGIKNRVKIFKRRHRSASRKDSSTRCTYAQTRYINLTTASYINLQNYFIFDSKILKQHEAHYCAQFVLVGSFLDICFSLCEKLLFFFLLGTKTNKGTFFLSFFFFSSVVFKTKRFHHYISVKDCKSFLINKHFPYFSTEKQFSFCSYY